MKKLVIMIIMILLTAGILFAQTGVKKKRPLPPDYGKVIINKYSEKSGIAPVEFDHWLHRARFTCRLCHVDIAFAMKANGSDIKAEDNMKGYYCGTCHNGKFSYEGKKVFEACSREFKQEDVKRCERCHSYGKISVKKEYDFSKFTERFPKERFGNGINWEKAEEMGLIKPVDFIEGVSITRPRLQMPKDFSIDAKVVEGLPDIIFSHKKHFVWMGCEGCHPEIFLGVKKGVTKYTMVDIFQGKYCGVCHGSVAFPLLDCQRCHTKQVQ